jgi:hypothetical protein
LQSLPFQQGASGTGFIVKGEPAISTLAPPKG